MTSAAKPRPTLWIGTAGLVACGVGLALIGSGDVLAARMPSAVARNRAVIGLVILWLGFAASLAQRTLR